MFVIDKGAGGLAQVVSEACDIRHDSVLQAIGQGIFYIYCCERPLLFLWYKSKPKYVSLIVLRIVLFVLFCLTLTLLVCMHHC